MTDKRNCGTSSQFPNGNLGKRTELLGSPESSWVNPAG